MVAAPGKSITGNFPINEITRVIRADRVRPGLLFIGTETGIYFSFDDGTDAGCAWRGGLPVVPVYDLKIKDDDLVAGTHGRSFWILDDIAPLRALADGNAGSRLIPATRDHPHQAAFWLDGRRAGALRFRDHFRHRRWYRNA